MLSGTNATLPVAETIDSHSVDGTDGEDPLVKRSQNYLVLDDLDDIR